MEELDQTLPAKPKDSAELLNLRKIQISLARQEDYIDAHKVQQKCGKLEKEELEKWKLVREQKIRGQKIQLEQKQQNELAALKKKILIGQEEQQKARAVELERLLQKYQNTRKELEVQHQIEIHKLNRPTKSASGSLYRSQGSRMGSQSKLNSHR
mmetsp:Transcript_36636/g.42804  ORF Transcript_36636/g.42804 Transcript_36636/m.42804 type:complete len:155 (+) Transcript_36636:1-465(+)